MTTLDSVKSGLTITGSSAHFLLFWGPSRGGFHLGTVGDELAREYSDWLDDIYCYLVGPPFHRRPPRGPKIPVYIFDPSKIFPNFSEPFTSAEWEGPYLVLPDEIDISDERGAMANVIREVTRMFNSIERDPRHSTSTQWAWFDAAFATKVADLVLLGERKSQPIHKPFNGPFGAAGTEEYALEFVDRLAGRIGLAGLNRLWLEGARNPSLTPMEVLEKEFLIPTEYMLPEFHRSWYLRHFVPSLTSGETYGAEYLEVRPGESIAIEGTLDHGACRWYRLQLQRDLESLDIALQPRSPNSRFAGWLGVVSDAGEYQSLRSFEPNGAGGFSVRLTRVQRNQHLALILSNYGTGGVRHSSNHHDRRFYSLRIQAVTSWALGA